MGSVKDLKIYKKATDSTLGNGDFVFSDRYSVFDWGEMPDNIPNKGAALCLMAAWNFEQLREERHSSHYLGVREKGEVISVNAISSPTNVMNISLSRVIEPIFRDGSFDYSYFTEGKGTLNNFVVPLEFIYRWGVPKGSSLLRTFNTLEKEGRLDEMRDLLSHYGLRTKPNEGDLFSQSGFDFTTKFESTDRPVSDGEAYCISGLTRAQFLQLKELRQAAIALVSQRTQEKGFIDYDGKHEYRLFDGRVHMADVFGTLDENRFMFNGCMVSKEFLRQVYRTEQGEWVADVERAKQKARQRGVEDWKSLTTLTPQPLDPRLITLVGEMYASACERYTGLLVFNARPLEEVLGNLEPYYPS